MEEKKVINVGTGTITIYTEREGNPYIELREGYEAEPKGLYLEYDECVDELIAALQEIKSKRNVNSI